MTAVAEPWWVCWRCGCDQTAEVRSELPVRCPGHDAERINPPEILWRNQRTEDRSTVEIGHACPDQTVHPWLPPCPPSSGS